MISHFGETRSNLAKASGIFPYPVSSLMQRSSAASTETTSSLRSDSYHTWICTRPDTCFSFAICSCHQGFHKTIQCSIIKLAFNVDFTFISKQQWLWKLGRDYWKHPLINALQLFMRYNSTYYGFKTSERLCGT